MRIVHSTVLGEFRLKCTRCQREMITVLGVHTTQLGEHVEESPCPTCNRSDSIIVVEVPTVDVRDV